MGWREKYWLFVVLKLGNVVCSVRTVHRTASVVVVACTVVDTSANYMGGNSELMVGEGVDRWRVSGGGEDKRLTVVSKFGYSSVSTRLS